MLNVPQLGHGIGLRGAHYQDVLAGPVDVDWFEIVSENYFRPGGNPRRVLRAVRERFPVVMHGVSLSIGSVDPLDRQYLTELKALAKEIEPAMISDHLCWTRFEGRQSHDLLPLPFTEEALAHIGSRVHQVQDHLQRPILIENVSSYMAFAASTLTEWDFLAELCRATGCGLLLDVNNVFVSAHNHGFAAEDFINGIPVDCVGQIHLAGHSERGRVLLDTHDHPVPDPVWALYRRAIARFGSVPTLVEWDDRIPDLDVVVEESRKARAAMRDTLAGTAGPGPSQPERALPTGGTHARP